MAENRSLLSAAARQYIRARTAAGEVLAAPPKSKGRQLSGLLRTLTELSGPACEIVK
jgi:hypothetical protein